MAKGSHVVTTELGYIDLDREYSTLLSVSIGRLALHEGDDYTLSLVGGVSRLTWVNSLANPAEEMLETGDNPSHHYIEEARAIGNFVKNHVRYVKDPVGTESLQAPDMMVQKIRRKQHQIHSVH